MSQTKLKSIEELVADLRSKGELDEEALKVFEGKYNRFVYLHFILAAIIILLGLINFRLIDSIIIVLVITLLYFYEFLPEKKKEEKLLYLFVYGVITNGVITKYKIRYNKSRDLKFVAFLSYIDSSKKQYFCKTFGSVKYNLDYDLEKGSQIQVIYVPENPDISWIYTEKLNNIYNIRKK